MRSQLDLETDWEKRNKVVPEKVIRKVIWDELHETMQDELNLKDEDYLMISDERFDKYLDTIEHNEMRRRETQKRAQDKPKSSSVSNDESHSSRGRIPKKARKEVKKTSQGKAMFWFLCKRSGMPYSKYSSHSDSSCNDAEYKKNRISGSVDDRDSVAKSFKKQEKYWKKELKRSQMKTDNFYKLISQPINKSDLNRIMKKMEDSSDSESNSNSESDTSTKQEICRSKPWEKPALKERVVEKEFRVSNTHIDTKTGDWLWESPYPSQGYKDEFSDGPYRSDIDSSEDERTTGRHYLNTMDSAIDELIR